MVNPDTAPVVRQIFQWAADGVSKNQIVLNLNENGTLSPGHYMASIGLISSKKLMGSGVWQTRTLEVILNDEVYVGDMVQGKRYWVAHKSTPVEPKDWIIVRNTHEPIITRELFERAQEKRKETTQKYTCSASKPYSQNILKGKIFCGGCGTALHRHRTKSGDGYCYYCLTNYRTRKGACTAKVYLTEAHLFEIIRIIARKKAEAMMGERLRLKQCDSKLSAQKKEVDTEIKELVRQTERNRELFAGLYENFIKGILTKAEYVELKEDYSGKISKAVQRVHQLQTQQTELEQQLAHYTSIADK